MIGSKVTTILTTLLQRQLIFFWVSNHSTVDNEGVSRGRSVAVGVGDRWKVTWDMRHVTCDMWLVTHNFFWNKKCQKKNNANKWLISAKKCRNVSKFGATLCTHRERRGVPYAVLFSFFFCEPQKTYNEIWHRKSKDIFRNSPRIRVTICHQKPHKTPGESLPPRGDLKPSQSLNIDIYYW